MPVREKLLNLTNTARNSYNQQVLENMRLPNLTLSPPPVSFGTTIRVPSQIYINMDHHLINLNSFRTPYVQLKSGYQALPLRNKSHMDAKNIEELEKLTLSGSNCQNVVQSMLADPYYQMLADNSKKP